MENERMELSLFDPTIFLLGKIVGGIIVLFLVIGFVPGVVVGWLFGRMTR
jgi:hypothetical protein